MAAKVLKFPSVAKPELAPSPVTVSSVAVSSRERTIDEFLADPWAALGSTPLDIPSEWIHEAWSQRMFRKRATEALIRSIAKTGDLFASADLLNALGRAGLRREVVVQLFVAIRDGVETAESEWRPDFEMAFSEHVESLPPIGDDQS